MEDNQTKQPMSRRNFVATLGAAGVGALLATGMGGFGGRAYAAVSDTLSSYDTVDQLQAATDLRVGTVVYTRGYYAAGDGGDAYWEVLGSATTDNLFVYACGGGKFAKLIHTGTVNIKQIGIRADGKQVDYTYSGTGTARDGTTQKFWVSESGSELKNREQLQKLVNAGCSVYVPKGNYVFNGLTSVRFKNGLSVIGESMRESVLIGLGFSNYGILDEGSDLLFENITFENLASILPPGNRKLKVPTDADFNASKHWDCYDYKSMTHKDGAYRSELQYAIVINNSPNHENRNVTVRRVKVRNFWTGLIFGTKTEAEPPYRTKGILVEQCEFEDIGFQAIGSNNVEYFRVIHNLMDNVGIHGCDFSRGSIGVEFSSNLVTRCPALMKVEGNISADYTRILSDDFLVKDNIYKNPPRLTDWQYEGLFVIDNLTGDGIVSGNFMEMAEHHLVAINSSIRREHLDDNVRITDNHIQTPAASKYDRVEIVRVQRTWINNAQDYPSAGKNVTFEHNDVVMRMATVGVNMPMPTNATQMSIRNNHFASDRNGYLDHLVQGCAVRVDIADNTLERVRRVINTIDTETNGVWGLDVKSISVVGNRVTSDYTLDVDALNLPLIRVIGNNNHVSRIIIRSNDTNRSRLLEVVKTGCALVDIAANLLQEEESNSAQFGYQTVAVDALVDEIRIADNTIRFPNQLDCNGIVQFLAANTRNIKRLIMENNSMTLSGLLATGVQSSGLKPELFLFRGNSVFRIQSDPYIWFAAGKGAVTANVFDSPNVKINAGGNLFTDYNTNLGGTITIENPRP